MSATLPRPERTCSNRGGKPVRAAIAVAEALVESLVTIDDEVDFLEAQSRAEAHLAQASHRRAQRLLLIRAEIHCAYQASESLVASNA